MHCILGMLDFDLGSKKVKMDKYGLASSYVFQY